MDDPRNLRWTSGGIGQIAERLDHYRTHDENAGGRCFVAAGLVILADSSPDTIR